MAITSAAKGWSCACILLLVLPTVNGLGIGSHIHFTDVLSILVIWTISTGLVTLAATILLIVPYVCLRDASALLRSPWRIYVESGVIATLASLILTYFVKPTAEPFSRSLLFYLAFALVTSLASSAFYIGAVKARSSRTALA